ncbi:acyltransferase family protein [Acuticoccus kandeliae]|uniref:acyltransferase family protein n=1 Tax=Acuticoccus kandeliae TaxID=2073160 RepID=UPI001300B95C|nr:acyltransferase [Acuticoccus kandeliae]
MRGHRFTTVDSFRGLFALTVALFHLPVVGSLHDVPLVRNAFLFVDFFFVLSGFVISYAFANAVTARSIVPFIVRRFGRLWPLHATVLLGFLSIETLLAVATAPQPGDPVAKIPFTENFAPSLLFQQLAFLDGFGLSGRVGWNLPSWSISAEFWVCVLFALVVVFARRAAVPAFAALFVAAGLAMVAFAGGTMDTFVELGFVRCVYGFAGGCLTYQLFVRRGTSGGAHSALEIATLGVALAFVWVYGATPVALAAPLVFCAVVYVFAVSTGGIVSRAMRHPWLQAIGERSYSIYLLHSLLIYVMLIVATGVERRRGLEILGPVPGKMLPMIDVAGPYGMVINNAITLLYLALLIALAGLTYRRIEVPARALFQRIAGRIATRRASAVVEEKARASA